jgi:CubicO group peptidase (beta-lactamase class C family)
MGAPHRSSARGRLEALWSASALKGPAPMLRLASLLFSFLVLALVADPVRAQSSLSPALAGRIDEAVLEGVARSGVPSASIAVVQDGRVVYTKAYGAARLAPPQPATAATRYSIGSVSKQFTATALLLLQQEGRLRLDDPVGKYLPGLTQGDRVSIRQVLSHTAGYSDYWPEDYVMTSMMQPTTPQAIIDRWGKKPLDFTPGAEWQYSNTGYVIAGQIAERVSGQPLFQFLQQRVFAPLHMSGVVDHDARPITAPDAAGYFRAALGPLRPAPEEGRGWMYAAGELAMPARDLALWDISLLEQRLLQPAAYRELFQTVKLSSGKDSHYALGLFVRDEGGRRMLEHSGETSGFVSENRVYPDDRAAIVVLTNLDASSGAADIADRIAYLLLPPKGIDAVVQDLFRGLQRGVVNRAMLTPFTSAYFDPQTVHDFAASLGALGEPREFKLQSESDRGGMKFRAYRVVFAQKTVRLTVYVMPDGKIEQFLVGPVTG